MWPLTMIMATYTTHVSRLASGIVMALDLHNRGRCPKLPATLLTCA